MEIKHLTKIRRKLKEKEGSSIILLIVVFFVGMVLLSVAYEYIRVQIIAGNIKDSFERAILTVASENYDEVYAGFREEKGTGGEYEGGPEDGGNATELPEWISLNDDGDVEDELSDLLSLDQEENYLYSDKDKYRLSDIIVKAKNADSTPSGKYEIVGSIKITLPIYLCGAIETNIEINRKVTTAYTAKY